MSNKQARGGSTSADGLNTDIVRNVGEHTTRLDQLQTQYSNLNLKLNELTEQTRDAATEQRNEFNVQLNNVNTRLDDLSGGLTTVGSRLDGLITQIATTQDAAQKQLDAMRKQQDAARKQQETLVRELQQLSANMNTQVRDAPPNLQPAGINQGASSTANLQANTQPPRTISPAGAQSSTNLAGSASVSGTAPLTGAAGGQPVSNDFDSRVQQMARLCDMRNGGPTTGQAITIGQNNANTQPQPPFEPEPEPISMPATTVYNTLPASFQPTVMESKPALVFQCLIGNNQRATKPPAPTKLVGNYDGTPGEPFDSWFARYELAMRINGASVHEIVAYVSLYLTGNAYMVYCSLPLTTLCDYAVMRTALSSRLNPQKSFAQTWLPVMHATQQKDETIEQLYMRILSQVQFQASTPDSELLLTTVLLKAMRPEVREGLGSIDNTQLTSVLARAKEVEARLEYRRQTSMMSSFPLRNAQQPYAPARRENTQQYAQGDTKQNTAKNMTPQTHNTNNNLVSANRLTAQFQGTCNACGQQGHKAADCRRKPWESRRPQLSLQEVYSSWPNEDEQQESPEHDDTDEGPLVLLDQQDGEDVPVEQVQAELSVQSLQNKQPVSFCAPEFSPMVEGVVMTGKLDSAAEISVMSRHLFEQLKQQTGKHIEEYDNTANMVDYSGNPLHCKKIVQLTVEDGDYSGVVPFMIDEKVKDKLLYGSRIFFDLFSSFVGQTPFSITFSSKRTPVPVAVSKPLKRYPSGASFVQLSASNELKGTECVFLSDNAALPDAVIAVDNDGRFILPCRSVDDALLLQTGNQVGHVCEIKENEVHKLPLNWSGANDAEPYEKPDKTAATDFEDSFDPERLNLLRELFNKAVHAQDGLDKDEFVNWLLERADAFALNDGELGTCNVLQHHIDTGNRAPFKDPPRRYSYSQKQIIMDIIRQWLKGGVIEPSTSPYCSQLLLVRKPDPLPGDEHRLCADMRTLNAQTVDDAQPLTPCSQVLARLGEAKARYFTKLDAKSGFLQLTLDEESRPKTAFASPAGLFQFRRVCFGLTTALQSFTRAMQLILSKYTNDPRVNVYVDDVVLATQGLKEMKELISDVMALFSAANIRLGPKKCQFFADRVSFLGHIVAAQGVSPDPKKVEAVESFPTPTTVKSLQCFNGLVNYLRMFSVPLCEVADPLFQVLKGRSGKDNSATIEWSDELESAFNGVKRLISSTEILIMPDPTKPYIIETDASRIGLGSALLQESEHDRALRPIAFAGRKLIESQRKYSATMRECLAVLWALQQFHEYVASHQVIVYSDHTALMALQTKKVLPDLLHRWALLIDQYKPIIRYRPGKLNALADAMSRKDNPAQARAAVKEHYEELSKLHAEFDSQGANVPKQFAFTFTENCQLQCETVTTTDKADTRQLQLNDRLCGDILRYLENGDLPEDEKRAKAVVAQSASFEVLNNVLYRAPEKTFEARLTVPRAMRTQVIHEFHTLPTSAHQRAQRTYERLRKSHWWPNMLADVVYSLDQCRLCATRSGTANKQRPALHCMDVSPFPLDKVALDLCTYPQATSGARYNLVVLDLFTKFVQAYPLPDKTAVTVANAFLDYCCRFSVPRVVLTDNGTEFINDLAKQTEKLLGVKHLRTTTYHPQTNGDVERMNREYHKMLSHFVNRSGSDWDRYVSLVTFAYNTTPHSSTAHTPFEMLFGRDPNLPSALAISEFAVPRYAQLADQLDYPQQLALRLREIWKAADGKLKKAQERYKQQHDKSAKATKVTVGCKVMALRPQLKQGDQRKFARPFTGPYTVISATDTTANIVPSTDPTAEPETIHLSKLTVAPSHMRDETWLGNTNYKRDRQEPVARPRAPIQD